MITSIRLQNFRSYGDESFEFDPGVNIVVGPNASGKTNLLEAVLMLCRGSSYRARDTELIKSGRPWARLDGFFGGHSRVLKLEDSNPPGKTFLLDDKPFRRLSLERSVAVVLFEPNHLQIITRGPEQRREYIDDLLERSQPGFKQMAAGYRRTLAQRNALLKNNPSYGQKQLFAWNIRLSELGGQIAQSRQALVDDIDKKISRSYSQIAHHKSSVSVSYESQFPADRYSSKMLAKLESGADLDYSRGFTSYGPHREDISLLLNKRLVNETASRGEARSLLLALKVFELELIEKSREQKPIFLLDDVFSELDSARRQALVDYLKGYQTVITTTDADAVIAHFATGTHHLIPL